MVRPTWLWCQPLPNEAGRRRRLRWPGSVPWVDQDTRHSYWLTWQPAARYERTRPVGQIWVLWKSGRLDVVVISFFIDLFWQVAALHQGRDPYDLSHEGEGPKDSTKTYRYSVCSHPHFPPTHPPTPSPPAAECKRICFCASCWNQRRDVVLFNVSRALLDISIWHTQTSLHTLNCMLWHIRLLLLVVYEHLSSNSFQIQIL